MAKKKEVLSCAEVLAELEANGTAQARKTYRNHGVTGDLFGVSYTFLKKLHKRVGTDHALALELWESGNHDARVFACWVADGELTTVKQLEAWAREVDNNALTYEITSLTQDTRHAARLAHKWIGMKSGWRPSIGWGVAGRLALQPDRAIEEGGLEDSAIAGLLERIETGIHGESNQTRHNMNAALIAIGCRPGWMTKALATAKRVGKVEVDYGKTSCKVNDAAEKIKKTVAHYKAKGKRVIDGTAGKRRRHC